MADNSLNLRFSNAFENNGWVRKYDKNSYFRDKYPKFEIEIDHVKVRVIVSKKEEDLHIDGYYGINWIEASVEDYEDEGFVSSGSMGEMLDAINSAEKNLLMIGIPFSEEYIFSRKKEKREAKNKIIREKWELDRYEREHHRFKRDDSEDECIEELENGK